MTQDAFKTAMEQVRRVSSQLEANVSFADETVLSAVAEFGGELRTNCEEAAQGMLAVVAPICRHRPDLVGPLLRCALLPLVCLGYERAVQVQEFVAWFLNEQSTYLPLSESGRDWLADEFPQHASLVQRLLDELIREAENRAMPRDPL